MQTRIVEVFDRQANRQRYFCQYRWLLWWKTIRNPLVKEPTCAFSGGYVTRRAAEHVIRSFTH
jgi:hypothetical protein